MPEIRTDGGREGRSAIGRISGSFDPEELRRRNPNAVAIDLLYLLATAFLAYLALEGFWPTVIAAVPLAALLYFGFKSSPPFFAAQLLSMAAAAAGWYTGVVPL